MSYVTSRSRSEATDTAAAVNYPQSIRLLLAVSPYSNYAQGDCDRPRLGLRQSHLAEWEKEAAGSPALLGAIARRYDALGKADLAERCSRITSSFRPTSGHTSCSPPATRNAVTMLAGSTVLEQFLEEGGDPGLDQARIRVQIANHYMQAKSSGTRPALMPTRPRPPAPAWAMICAQDCAEGRKDWAPGRAMGSRSQRTLPDGAGDRWYLAVQADRQGRRPGGRLIAASNGRKPAPAGANLQTLERIAWFYVASGEPKEALPILRQLYQATPSTSAALKRGSSPT